MIKQTTPLLLSRHSIWRLVKRTLFKSWDDSIFSESAQSAFWCALSLPPLLLGMLGSLAYIAPLFGPDTLITIQNQLINASNSFFSANVVNEIIAPTICDIVKASRGELISVGFVISLWAGSSAVSAFVDSTVEAHGQTLLRHPVRQRFYALGLYIVMLLFTIIIAPFVALGPKIISAHIPNGWDSIVFFYSYYPAIFFAVLLSVVALYRVSLPDPIPTHRLLIGAFLATVVFLVATFGLRTYLTWITSTGYTYGGLATPIAFLLFAFFLGFAVMLGAELNAAVQEAWPAADTHIERLQKWIKKQLLNQLNKHNFV